MRFIYSLSQHASKKEAKANIPSFPPKLCLCSKIKYVLNLFLLGNEEWEIQGVPEVGGRDGRSRE